LLRLLRRIAASFGAAVLVLVFLGLVGTVIPSGPRLASAGGDSEAMRTIRIAYNAIHTDLAFPADPDVLTRFGFLANAGLPLDHPELRWLVVGWGGRAFFVETPTWADLKPRPVLKALTIDRAVMHVVLSTEFAADADNLITTSLTQSQFDALLDAALAGFIRDGNDQPIEVAGAAYGDGDRFYEGVGWFNALLGCNTWAAAALRNAGFRTGLWNPLPVSLRWSLALFNSCDGKDCRPAG
jgi:uncharacterized protein (TIGR02117 family)